MAKLSRSALEAFEDRMVIHLNKCFPAQCKAGGEPKVRETIRYGIERASTHGMTAERDVCKFIDLMFVYGRNFDVDPNLTWPSAVFNDRSLRDPTIKMEVLYETGMQHQPGAKSHG
jgi:hypothetical protein